MTTGPDHYRKAEELLAQTKSVSWRAEDTPAAVAAAQVHATLALAAATAAAALNDGEDGTPGPVYRTWLAVASDETTETA